MIFQNWRYREIWQIWFVYRPYYQSIFLYKRLAHVGLYITYIWCVIYKLYIIREYDKIIFECKQTSLQI